MEFILVLIEVFAVWILLTSIAMLYLERKKELLYEEYNKQYEKFKNIYPAVKDLYKKLCQEYGKETVYTVLRFIKQDEFRCKQIQSIGKLCKKNKDWIPYIVVIMDKMMQTKANIIDLDSL